MNLSPEFMEIFILFTYMDITQIYGVEPEDITLEFFNFVIGNFTIHTSLDEWRTMITLEEALATTLDLHWKNTHLKFTEFGMDFDISIPLT